MQAARSLPCSQNSAHFYLPWARQTQSTLSETISVRSILILYSNLSKSSYRGDHKSLARPGRKQANVSVRMEWISFSALPCQKNLDDSSRLDFVEIARVPDMFPSLFPSWSG